MTGRLRRANRAALLLLAAAGTAHAGGLAVGEQDAVSAGTGGAGAARAGDPGAAWHDPAALADDGGWRVGLSLAAARASLEAEGPDWATSSTGAWSTPPHLDASYAHGRWAAGVALGVPFGGGATWPAMWPGAFEAVQTQLTDLRVAPFFAWRLGPVRLAAGVHVDTAELQLERGLDFIDTQGDVRMDLTGTGVGVDASAYWQARADLGLGLAYRGRTAIHFAGPADFTAPAAFSDETPDQQAQTQLTLPDQLVLGARWQRGAVGLLADVEYTHWRLDRQMVIAFADPATPEAMQDQEWHDTFGVRGGAEWQHGRLALRGGGYVDPTPVPASHLNPTTPDGTRLGITAGASWRLARAWNADVFAERMWILRRTTTSPDTMPASYGGSAVVLGAGLRWAP